MNLLKRFRFFVCVALFLAGIGVTRAIDYPIDRFEIEYQTGREDLPSVMEMRSIEVALTRVNGVYGSVTTAGIPATVRLGEIEPGSVFNNEALQEILNAIVRYLNEQDIYGVYIVPQRNQIAPRNGRDRRREGDTSLGIEISVGEIQQIQSVAKGERIREDRPIDNPKHSPIVKHSPLQPATQESGPYLFRKEALDDYLRRLNRHPGRRVDATIASSGEPGKIDLHYLVTESRPWSVYGQVSNTGTEGVGEWQYRAGASQTQVFGYDDIATVDYLASDLNRSYSIIAGYNIPVIYPDYIRFSLLGSYSEFVGEQFAASTVLEFSGRVITGQAEGRVSPYSLWGFAIDGYGGVQWEAYRVTQQIFLAGQDGAATDDAVSSTQGKDVVVSPYLGLSIEKSSRSFMTAFNLSVEWNLDRIQANQLDRLGRLDADDNRVILGWELQQSVFLEPWFDRDDWSDLKDWRSSTLAHELMINVAGQYSVTEQRVIPQKQFVIGGMYSVRGYPESVAAADHGFFIQSEYRLHLPRLLKPYSEFERDERPPQLYGRWNVRPPRSLILPDWDLILKAFIDYGQTENVDLQQYETDQDLASCGFGIELQLIQQLTLRTDVGWVLEELSEFDSSTGGRRPITGAVDGDLRVHFLGTYAW